MLSRGQGAMEYLMSYGWAILLVMAVGMGMWQLGIFHWGGTPPTSSGFQSLKPLLVTCDMKPSALIGFAAVNYNGFICQFLNTERSTLIISQSHAINFTVNDQICGVSIITLTPDEPFAPYLYRGYEGVHIPLTCVNCPPGVVSLSIPVDSQFTVFTGSSFNGGNPVGPCYYLSDGEPYEVSVELSYTVNVGGFNSVKHSKGRVHITAET